MCGISGIITNKNSIKKYQNSINQMIDALSFRGPDGSGFYFFDNCVLGHNRLSIIDLSTGSQPMLNKSGDLGVTFNGEIYGYLDIKKNLIDYPFQTSSDTEVILAFYEKYGIEMTTHLPGMFAFALWDEKKKILFAARDRFGEKPFYYAWGKDGELVFASEIKAILNSGLVDPVLSIPAIADYLRQLYVGSQVSVYENIFVLPPGCCLTYDLNELKIKKYYQLPETNETISLMDAVGKCESLLDIAIKRQLIADVPVGAFLSGGLDSSTIVAIASRYKQGIKTFSFGFGDSINELPFAREVAEKYNTDHTELQIGDYDIYQLMFKMQEIYDEPLADTSSIPTYLISQAASKHTKVVLTGDAGDELFGGYWSWYRRLVYFSLFKKDPIKALTLLVSDFNINQLKDCYYGFNGIAQSLRFNSLIKAHLNNIGIFKGYEIDRLIGKEKNNSLNIFPRLKNDVNDAIYFDISNYMPGDILVKTDRASMFAGIELRSPFLDHELADFLISLPVSLKINHNRDKIIMREAFSKLWPESIRSRKKQGFGSPITKWLKDKKIAQLKNDYLGDTNNKIYSILNFNEVKTYLMKDDYRLWALLNLSLWLETRKTAFKIKSP